MNFLSKNQKNLSTTYRHFPQHQHCSACELSVVEGVFQGSCWDVKVGRFLLVCCVSVTMFGKQCLVTMLRTRHVERPEDLSKLFLWSWMWVLREQDALVETTWNMFRMLLMRVCSCHRSIKAVDVLCWRVLIGYVESMLRACHVESCWGVVAICHEHVIAVSYHQHMFSEMLLRWS